MKVKVTKNGGLFISCVGFPMCKNALNLPKGIIHLELDRLCEKCYGKGKREVKKFRLTFDKDILNESMAEALPERENTQGVFCVIPYCDDNY
jgi:ssDNA-binding Zn-finger/Zn-ribbon topoisomerase 1